VKIALLVAYDGTDFRGFARQPHARTVQGSLEEALSQLLRIEVRTTGAGRTDAGVHAAGQVVSFEAPPDTDPERVKERLNRRLGPEISIRAAAAVSDSFDARHSARKRVYEYHVHVGDAPDPFTERYTVRTPGRLDVGSMRRAAKILIGEHDFSSFCRRGDGSMVRRLRSIAIKTSDSERLVIRVVADSFCHQMVRSIVGLLLDIGRGKRTVVNAKEALEARDRAAAGPVAPAKGLSLVEVGYARTPFGRHDSGLPVT
jgi:tRNA pseudouridine38-40 synthase